MFKGAKKEDLRRIASELELCVSDKLTVLDLMDLIKNCDRYKNDPDSVHELANLIIEERKYDESQQLELEKIRKKSKLDLEIARIRANDKDNNTEVNCNDSFSVDSLIKSIRTLTVKIPDKPEGWSFFFLSLERAFAAKSVTDKFKPEILLNLLGEKAANIIIYLNDEDLKNYDKIKSIILQEFEPTPQSCLENFKKATRQNCESHVQFASRLTTNWEYYLKLRNVSNFEVLKQLIVSDKIFSTLDKETASHISVRQADKWFDPLTLGKEIDLFYSSRGKPLKYKELGHMQEVDEREERGMYFIPHLGVYRSDKKTSKLRVVFNASSATTNGYSLNSLQYNGGVAQNDLFSIMVRFRKHIFAFIADVQKMYRMIWINPDQRKLQRILWRENMDEPIKTFELSTVTYGTTSAPFLATRTLKQLALDEAGNFPLGSSVVMSDMYIDDVLTGAETLLEAKELKNQLINIFAKGGMVLHKWCGNNTELIEVSENYDFSDSSEIKVLGVYWNPKHDCFSFRVKIDLHELNTKRDVLSTIARIYDPLGLLGPVVAKAKFFLQKLWMLKIDWTDLLPDTINREWRQFVESLQVVNDININRCIVVEQPEVIELHGFSDASQSAYGAVVYCKSITSDGKMLVHLIASKSRVAPTKQTTIPRLELCAAVLLAKLVHRVKQALKLNVTNTFLWSDSMIVLSWIRKESYQLKTFVANRIATIQEMTSSEQWRYVATEDNPADFVSRGMDSLKLKTCELWWNGPKFLMSNQYPQRQIPVAVIKDPGELKNCSDFSNFFLDSATNSFVNNLLNLSNDYFKIIRVLSFICRFVYNCKSKESKGIGPLDLGELKKTEQLLLKLVQKEEFKVEMNGIQNSVMVSSNSRVKTLNPFIDSEGILRVGGRLRNSDINYNQKFPILLPSKHKLTYLIVEYFHKKFLHSGPQSLLYQIRQNIWILNGRNICRKVVLNCVNCCKANPTCTDQIMADLPKDRVIKNYPFNVSAVHLDIVTDLTSNAFIATLKRFIFRRGRSITSIVEPDLTNLNENRLDNWQKITKIIQLIWKRWSVDYLNSLQQRNKWHFEKKNAKIGDMVIIKEDNLPSCQWSLGRINNIYPGKDSKVRVVEVKTTRGCFKDERNSKPIIEFVGLRAKMYSMLTPDSEKKTAKGASKVVIQQKLKHSNYLQCLKECKSTKENMFLIKSENHDIYTIKRNKTALLSFDDKRYILDDNIGTFAYGHYKINENSI
ncbi:integrase catalytic domain-containing protein [Trichonephila clavipes]|nr:integrase catalytic domain-containing protein [Trichonephila clavipes]